MKIGFEIEGVIRSIKTKEITRWSKINESARTKIKRIIDWGQSADWKKTTHENPFDTYDCLAEARTAPIDNPKDARDLLFPLFVQLDKVTRAYQDNGYNIEWFEQQISDELHAEIQKDIGDEDDKKCSNRPYKQIYTFSDNRTVNYTSENNRFRGGGVHINISSIPAIFAPALIFKLDTALRGYTSEFEFKSHYRKNVLFRTRSQDNNDIIEYMTFGFNLKNQSGWQKAFETTRFHFHWADALLRTVNDFFESAKLIK